MNTLRVLTIAALLLSFCVDCYFLSRKFSWTIDIGIKPDDIQHNLGFWTNIVALIFMLWSLYIVVIEIINITDTIDAFDDFDISIDKSLIVLTIGLGHIGMCGDLGFSSGIITLASGVIWLIVGIVAKANGDY